MLPICQPRDVAAGRIVADASHSLIAKRIKGVRVWDGWSEFSQFSFADP